MPDREQSAQGYSQRWRAAVLRGLPQDIDPELAEYWIWNKRALAVALRGALVRPRGIWSVWKSIKLGTGLSNASDIQAALDSNWCQIDEWTVDILRRPEFNVARVEGQVKLVSVLVNDLGFNHGAQYGDICIRGLDLGLRYSPAEVGPQLRLQYYDQPEGEVLHIAMEAIIGLSGGPVVFAVGRNKNGLWLSRNGGDSNDYYPPDARFVFVQPVMGN